MEFAGVVKLAYTQCSERCGGNPVEVQILSPAHGSGSCKISGLTWFWAYPRV